MKVVVVAVLVLLVVVVFFANSRKAAAEYINLNAEEAAKLIEDNKGNENFVIIDVRTPAEHQNDGVIPGSINIDIGSNDFSERIAALDPAKTYLVYCRSGNRSRSALGTLKKYNILNVYHLDGGYKAFKKLTASGL